MAITTAPLSPEESQEEQLKEFVLEAGTHFAESSKAAADILIRYATDKCVIDLGCGDGAASPFFMEQGFVVIGVDINQTKLIANPAITVLQDMVSYLRERPDNSLPNIFAHHSLEHLPNPQDVLDLIAAKLAVGGVFYGEVPANDPVHSVHHASFSDAMDLLPPGLTPLERGMSEGTYYLIARKDHELEPATK